MEKENTSQPEAAPANVIDDLTVSETETTKIKGGTPGRYLLELRDLKGDVEEPR